MTISPSDLDGQRGEAKVAGRVVETDGLDLVLADAFTSVAVELERAEAIEPGDLVVLAGRVEEGRLLGARLVERFAPASPPVLAPADAIDLDAPAASETERLVARQVGQALVARSVAIATIRRFFGERRFLEVDTPAVVPSPGLDLHLDAFEVKDDGYLVTSPEYQMKRLLAGGVPRLFQLARCFRRGERGRRHNPEFLMLEWYRAFAGVAEIIDDTEALVRFAAAELLGATHLEVGGTRVDLEGPFERLTVGDAFARWAGVSADEAIAMAGADEERFFRLLVDRVEPELARAPRPVFLVDYPAPLASLARLRPDDPRVAERFELYVGGVELCNGFGELTDPAEQRARLERDQEARSKRGLPVYPIDERFLAALEEGMPPAGGNALGVERLIAVLLGADDIATVQAFPAGWL